MKFNTDATERARWRPISQYHEDRGIVIALNIADPGGVAIAWADDIPGDFTHWAELPLLTAETIEELESESAAPCGDPPSVGH